VSHPAFFFSFLFFFFLGGGGGGGGGCLLVSQLSITSYFPSTREIEKLNTLKIRGAAHD
jgi:hypothetical protein